MAIPQIAHAKLIPMNGDQVETDEAKHITVQFNPATLKVSLANTLKADGKGGGSSAAQFVDKSESSLSVDLVFDTSVERPGFPAGGDVRKQTQKIAETFMKPKGPAGGSSKPKAPAKCRFQWGSFKFTGMLASYSETLDFFAPEGVPLRATLSLSFKEDRYQFDIDESVRTAARAAPTFATGGGSAAQAAQAAGQNPRQWRDVADHNQLDNPRFTPEGGVAVPSGS